MLVTPLPIDTERRFGQLANMLTSRNLTLLGITMLDRQGSLQNAKGAMSDTLAGIVVDEQPIRRQFSSVSMMALHPPRES